MSEELKKMSESVMQKIHTEHITMRPKVYFVLGSILTFIGLVASVLVSVFLFGLLRFSLRSHGPMGEYRWDQLLNTFPWWAVVVAFLSITVGIWFIRKYDFSYKLDIRIVIVGFILALFVAGWIFDMIGLNDTLSRRGPMKKMMQQYVSDPDTIERPMHNGWKNRER